MSAQMRIGTSGWHYKHWCGSIYPKKCPRSQWFDRYARLFDTVELNNSFYRLPTEDAIRHWHDAAPPGFCFAVRASRFITHLKRLRDPENAIAIYVYFNNDQHGYAVTNAQALQRVLSRNLSRAA